MAELAPSAPESRLPQLSDAGREVVADAVDALSARADDIVRDFDQSALALSSIADVADALQDTLERSTRAQLLAGLALLRAWSDPVLAQNPPDALGLGRDLVRLGLSMDALVGLYRKGHEYIWELVYEEIHSRVDDTELLIEIVRAVTAWLFAYMDVILQPLLDDYVAERERRARLAETTRADEVRRILSGETLNIDRSSARLGYELRRWHLGFVAWMAPDGDEDEVRLRLQTVASEIARALGAGDRAPLLVAAAGFTVHGWVGFPAPVGDTPELPRLADVHVAVGDPGEGLDGFRATHEQAALARRVATLARKRPGTAIVYRDIAVEALLTADLAHARTFVRRVLGPLANDDDSARRLLATLQIFYEEESNSARAARRLNLHHNTIAYRVNRALELVEPENIASLRLRVAVLLHSVLGGADETNG
jgi:PucR C-terminal helix-turn-helix domain/GGDEF-like domain